MIAELNEFHFLRPLSLALLPLVFLAWLSIRRASKSGAWEEYLPSHVIAALKVSDSAQSNWWHGLLLLCWTIMVFGLAGPTWSKQAVPTIETQDAIVMVLDLSPSMLAEDLTPNRLVLAKFKVIDMLRKVEDTQVALIAYAGDAHTVSPLTDDPKTIEALLPALHPRIMPSVGSNTEAAIELAQQLLKDAGVGSGTILLISDGVTPNAIATVQRQLSNANRLSILGVGGLDAAPIPAGNGGFLRKAKGEILLAQVNAAELRTLAQNSGGLFARLSANDSDINSLLETDNAARDNAQQNQETVYDAWADMGHWLILFILPLFILIFRKGLIYSLPLIFLMPLDSNASNDESVNTQSSSFWQDLWQTKDQQAATLMKQDNFSKAATTFENQDWSAVANYKAGDYESAVRTLEGKQDINSLYNKANALAFQGELKKAISIYQQVLEQDQAHADAKHNKELLEKLLQQQEQNQSQNNQDQSDQQQDSDKNEQSSENQQNQEQNQNSADQDSSQQQSSDEQGQQEQQAQDSQQQGDTDSSEQQQESQNSSDTQAKEHGGESSNDAEDSEKTDQDTEQSEEEAQAKAAQEQQGDEGDNDQSSETTMKATPNATPLKDSSEQWLRTIQDDPSGLLRRKFEYQARERQQQLRNGQAPKNQADQERY